MRWTTSPLRGPGRFGEHQLARQGPTPISFEHPPSGEVVNDPGATHFIGQGQAV